MTALRDFVNFEIPSDTDSLNSDPLPGPGNVMSTLKIHIPARATTTAQSPASSRNVRGQSSGHGSSLKKAPATTPKIRTALKHATKGSGKGGSKTTSSTVTQRKATAVTHSVKVKPSSDSSRSKVDKALRTLWSHSHVNGSLIQVSFTAAAVLESSTMGRRRGRPRKAPASSPIHASEPSELDVTTFSVSVYVHLPRPPRIEKTTRGKERIEHQEDDVRGPVTVSNETTWPRLLRDIADVVSVDVEDLRLRIHSLRWKVQVTDSKLNSKKVSSLPSHWLPLTSAKGFDEFVNTGIKQAIRLDAASTVHMISCSPPPPSQASASSQKLVRFMYCLVLSKC